MPDRPTAPADKHLDLSCNDGSLVHPMIDQIRKVQATAAFSGGDSYFNKTLDWRGNKSFYRSGFNYTMSTMNFNHTAAMGALLGGSLINSERAMADGRHGIEHYPLRLWCWYDGSTQESIDHYYLSITLTAQKMIADFGPTQFDRMLGRSILLKTVDELAGSYHPGLHRFISGSSRTSPNHILVSQDGVYHILHSLSRRGVLRDLDNKDLPAGMPAIGQEVKPAHIARQTLQGPWAPDWLASVVDDKPLPWEMTCSYKQWGKHAKLPITKRTYLGRNYGLYSADSQTGIIPILGQWRREAKDVSRMQEIGTLIMRYGINTTRLVNDAPGWIGTYGVQTTLQHKGRMIVIASPREWLDTKREIKSLQSTIALYNYQSPTPTWRIFIDGKVVESFPAQAKASQRITIHDGVSYLGVIPLPATDLGRNDEVVLSEGDTQEFGKVAYKAALVIDNYNMKRDTALEKNPDFARIDKACGGFIVEMADVSEYPTLEAFQQHMAAAKLEARYEEPASISHVKYTSDKDVMELGVYTTYKEGDTLDKCFAYRRVNGAQPCLPEGVERDSSIAQQSCTGRIEKNGAVLTVGKGAMAYVQADPAAGVYAAYNPLPDPSEFRFDVPGGITARADGKVGIAHLLVRPADNYVKLDYAVSPAQSNTDLAKSLIVTGLRDNPRIEFNGQILRDVPRVDGGWRIPLQ